MLELTLRHMLIGTTLFVPMGHLQKLSPAASSAIAVPHAAMQVAGEQTQPKHLTFHNKATRQ